MSDKHFRWGNRLVGIAHGETLYKEIRGRKHILRVPPAIAWNMDAVTRAAGDGISLLHALDTENGTHYWVHIAVAFPPQSPPKPLDYGQGIRTQRGGFELQTAVRLEDYRRTAAEAVQYRDALVEAAARKAEEDAAEAERAARADPQARLF